MELYSSAGKPGKLVQIPEGQVKSLCTAVLALRTSGPTEICGNPGRETDTRLELNVGKKLLECRRLYK